MSLEVVWNRLPHVRRAEAVATAPAALGGDSTYAATVRCETAEDEIRWFETGVTRRECCEFAATNAYRFTRDGNALHIAHLRVGDPVHLVTLADSPAALESTSPHVCGPDLYSLRLTLHTNGLLMVWRIESPLGVAAIHATYSMP
ncbi:MAG: DUF6314 family protein [Phycisphaerales bacterium]|jgi:hypothetical protein